MDGSSDTTKSLLNKALDCYNVESMNDVGELLRRVTSSAPTDFAAVRV